MKTLRLVGIALVSLLVALAANAGETASTVGTTESAPAPVPEDPVALRLLELVEQRPASREAVRRLCERFDRSAGIEALIDIVRSKQEEVADPSALSGVLGQIYAYVGRHEQAAAQFAHVVERAPDVLLWRLLLGRSLASTGRQEEAIEQLRTVTESDAGARLKAEAALAWGEAEARLGRRDAAVRAWKLIGSEAGAGLYAIQQVAEILARNRFYDEAVSEYKRILDDPRAGSYQRVTSLAAIGDLYARIDRIDEAIDTYHEALDETAPGHPLQEELFQKVVALAGDSGRLEELRHRYEELRAAHPSDPLALLRLARLERRFFSREEALALYEEAVRVLPRSVDVLKEAIDAFAEARSHDRAIELAERLVDLTGGTVESYIELARLAELSGDEKRAREVLLQASERHGDDAYALGQVARKLDRSGFLEEAITVARRGADLAPADADAASLAGELLLRAGRKGEARQVWYRIALASPDDPWAWAAEHVV